MRLTFRITLIAILMALLFSTVAVIGILSYFNSQANAKDLSSQVLEQTSQRMDLWIGNLLSIATRQSNINLKLLTSKQLGTEDFTPLAKYWLKVMEVHTELTYLSIGMEGTGNMLSIERRRTGGLSIRELHRRENNNLEMFDYWQEDYLERKHYVHRDDASDGDPTGRPWYLQAKAAGKQVWSPTYTFIGAGGFETITGVTCATPVYRKDGTLVGIMTADFDIIAISEFLAANPVGREGFAFVVEQRDDGEMRVISHPTPKILTRVVKDNKGVKLHELVPTDQLSDKSVVTLVEKIASAPGEASKAKLQTVEFNVDDIDYIGGYRRLSGKNVPNWIIGMVIPRSEVMGRVERNNMITLVIAIVSFFITLMASIWISTRVSKPMKKIARESEAIGRFEVDAKPIGHSIIKEVDQLMVATEDMKTSLRSFQKYVPADLVREILASGEEAELGARKATLTVFFSDITNFTSIAEKMPPEELVDHMGDYFEEMSHQILKERGTVERFVGDGICAFWGAPTPNPDHALSACRAAVRCQQRLRKLREKWEAEGKPLFFVRIGMNTGEMVVGNMGSASRLNYTVNGDNVNIASRLEGLNKYYGTRIIISENTFREVKDHVVARPLESVSLKGKTKGIMVYELLGLKGEVPEEKLRVVELYSKALQLYLNRKWDEAQKVFEEVLEISQGDRAAESMIERCRRYRESPPPQDWDGIHRIETK